VTVEPAPARRRGIGRLGPLGPPVLLLTAMWALEVLDVVLRGRLDGAGIEAREADGLLGILFAPFLHAGFSHLLANTVPLLVLGTLVATSGARTFWLVTAVVAVLGGLGTWLLAPSNSVTIGASGLVFGYLGYLLVAGVRTRHWRDLLVGLGVLVVYGSLLLGALPWVVGPGVSWQGHLFGALAGGLAAWWWAPQPRRAQQPTG
jgi:membrane associated rhomboid family serine protease